MFSIGFAAGVADAHRRLCAGRAIECVVPSGRASAVPRQRVLQLAPLLRTFVASQEVEPRLPFDPVEVPRRYREPEDVEAAGLIAASLAYGRADVFKPRIERILEVMGPRPARFARAYARDPDPAAFAGIRYRFNQPRDFAALVAAIGWIGNEHGTLGARFRSLFAVTRNVRSALARFGRELREAPPAALLLHARGKRGLRYLLPDAGLPGASKRWNLYLRWMVRGPDAVDLGVWRKHVPTAALVIPLDTHIARIAHYLGLTDRTDLSWRTAEDITASLRLIDPIDPVRFDFALCHHGMSGACPITLSAIRCAACRLTPACRRLPE